MKQIDVCRYHKAGAAGQRADLADPEQHVGARQHDVSCVAKIKDLAGAEVGCDNTSLAYRD